MPRAANLLMIASMLLFLAAGYATVGIPRLTGGRIVTALLTVQTGLTIAFAATAITHRSGWDLFTAAILAAGSAMVWEMHLAARAGRASRLVWRRVNRKLARRRGGRRLWTLAELRAEYAQTILDDAEQDRELAAILDEFADRIAAGITQKGSTPLAGPTELLAAKTYG